MSYNLEVTTSKPTGTDWFIVAFPEEQTVVAEWQSSFPGLLEVSTTEIDANTLLTTMIFENETAYNTYAFERMSQPAWVSKNEYYTSIGATVVTEIIDRK